LNEKTKSTFLAAGKHGRYYDVVKDRADVDFVVRLSERTTVILSKTFDFSKTRIKQLIQMDITKVRSR
jgi:hypothetical protein